MKVAIGALLSVVLVFLFASQVPATEIIVNAGAGGPSYQEHGNWDESSAKTSLTTCSPNVSRVTEENGAYAHFIPTIPESWIYYDVYIAWGDWTDGPGGTGPNAKDVTFNIHGITDTTVVLEQKGSKCGVKNGDQWIYLCRMEFDAGTSGYVEVKNTSTDKCYKGCAGSKCAKQFVNADAVKLVYVGPTPAGSSNWGTIKAMYR
jgi:hypothetical protein